MKIQKPGFKINLLSILLLLIVGSGLGQAQNTAFYDQPDAIFRDAVELYSKAKYSSARKQFRRAIAKCEESNYYMISEARFYIAACGARLYNRNADIELRAFTDEYTTSNRMDEVRMILADYLYFYKKYDEAIKEYEKIDVEELTDNDRLDYLFHYGYSAFSSKQYSEARSALYPLTTEESKYRVVATYYYAYILYTEGKYQSALNEFEKIESDLSFANIVPYYMLQIYHVQGRYNDVLTVGPDLLSQASPKRAPEVARLIGEAYYHQGDYAKALPMLNLYFEKSAQSPDQDGAYLLAYSYYKENKLDTASNYFLRVVSLNPKNELAQSALYHLGYCYAKEGKKKFAMDAFRNASQIDSNSFIREDAMYQYAKLSYDIGLAPYKESVSVFEQFLKEYPQSVYNKKIYEYMIKTYTNSRNYTEALASLEKINLLLPELQIVKQTLLFNQGVERFNTGKYKEATESFKKSTEVNFVEDISVRTLFWNGECAYRLGNTDSAFELLSLFITHPKAVYSPEYALGFYNLGYVLMESIKYAEAAKNFERFLKIAKGSDTLYLSDARLRAGDCEFMLCDFEKAQAYYASVIRKGDILLDYAHYRQALCKGAKGHYQAKIDELLYLVENYPQTHYMPMIISELAATYMVLENNSKALVYYKQVRDNYPHQALSRAAMLKIGLIYFNMGESQKALGDFQRLVADYPNTVEAKQALVSIRNIYMALNKIDDFFDYAKTLPMARIEESEKDSLTYAVAENLYMSGDCAGAITGLSTYLQRHPQGSFITQAWFYLAECAYKNGSDSIAGAAYSKVASLPDCDFTEKAVRRAASICFKNKQYDQALGFYKRMLLLQTPGTEMEALMGRLRCFYLLGQDKNTLEAAASILRKDNIQRSDVEEARTYMAHIAVKVGDEPLAKQMYTELMKALNPNVQAQARYYMIEKRVAYGELNTAEKLIFDYIGNAPADDYYLAKIYILWADIYEQRGNILQAKQTLQSIIDNYDGTDDLVNMARRKYAAIEATEQAEREIEERERAGQYAEEEEIVIPEM